MNLKTRFLLIALSFVAISLPAQRTADFEGSKDCPMISRFKGSVIEYQKITKWGTYKLPAIGDNKLDFKNPVILEGSVNRIQYSTALDNNTEYVMMNYKNAFEKAGVTILVSKSNEELGRSQDFVQQYYYYNEYAGGLSNEKFGLHHTFHNWKEHSFIAGKVNKGEKDYYFAVYIIDRSSFTLIVQDVIEVEAPDTGLVTADLISTEIEANGFIAVYDILFDTGKSEVKPDSDTTIKIVASYLKENPEKRFFIVGHTDNVGDLSSNIELSKQRAESVVKLLVEKHSIDARQLSYHGVGSLSPVAPNNTAEGRMKNRRVEIVAR